MSVPSVGDVLAVATLARNLYELLKDCPDEVERISKDLAIVYGILHHITEDLVTPESAIKAHGENRIRMLEAMVKDLHKTLDQIKKLVERYRHLDHRDGKTTASKMDQVWMRLKWVIGERKIKRLHQDISIHISRFGLLMTSMGK